MQLLPHGIPDIHSAASHLDTVLSLAANTGEEYLNKGSDFLAALNQELSQAGVTPLDVEAGSSAPRGFRSRESENGALNDEDLDALRETLKKRGVPETDLAAIDALLESGSVSSMGGLMAALAGFRRTGSELSATESEKLDSALRALRFSDDEIASLRGMMDGGATGQAMKSIRARLGELGGDVTIGRDELSALLRGLDVTDSTRGAILSRFGNSGERSLTTEELQGLLGPAGAEMARKENSRQAIAAELRSALDEVLRTKKQREDAELLSDARGSKKADRAETRMRDAMSAKGMGMGPEALARRMREDAEALNAEDFSGDPEQEAYAFLQKENSSSGGNAGSGAKAWLADNEAGAGSARKKGGSDGTQSSFASAFSRVTAEGMFSGAAQSGAAQRNAPLPRSMHEEVFSQVQKGILKELHDGSRQLTLRLDPAELGQVSVMLTVNKGEVRAVLRVENAEASAALSEQMSQLKASLEEQGLKVSQLEVQTRLGDEAPAREWGRDEYHNQEQEMREQARFQQLARMRREAAEELAQDMHSIGQREENSRSGLHIVA